MLEALQETIEASAKCLGADQAPAFLATVPKVWQEIQERQAEQVANANEDCDAEEVILMLASVYGYSNAPFDGSGRQFRNKIPAMTKFMNGLGIASVHFSKLTRLDFTCCTVEIANCGTHRESCAFQDSFLPFFMQSVLPQQLMTMRTFPVV